MSLMVFVHVVQPLLNKISKIIQVGIQRGKLILPQG